MIQLGDLSRYPSALKRRRWAPPRPFCMIDGNHDYFPELAGLTEPTEIAPGLTYLPRGTVLDLEGRRVGILGGADSVIDAAWRVPGEDWWPEEERISDDDVARLLANPLRVGGLHLMITHTPPASVTMAMMNDGRAPHPSSVQVERAWDALGRPPLIAGHMHDAAETPPGQHWGGGVEVVPFLGITVRP